MSQCSHCHQGPDTLPDLSKLNESLPCPAQDQWPKLQQNLSAEDPADLSWVRENYFSAYRAQHPHRAPLQLDIPKADLQVRLVPRNFDSTLLSVWVGKLGEIRGQAKVRENKIPLSMESLVIFTDILVDGPGWLNLVPDRISVGDYGILHFIGRVTPSVYEDMTDDWTGIDRTVLDFLQYDKNLLRALFPPYGPAGQFPLGRETPTQGQQPHDLTRCCAEPLESGLENFFACMTEDHSLPYCRPFEYPHPQENPKLDFAIDHHLPKELVQENCRLPEAFELNALLARILKMEGSGSGFDLEKIIDGIQEGEILLSIEELKDLYFPGILDLGKSSGRFTLNKTQENILHFSGEDIEIKLDPLGPLLEGRIRSGDSYTDIHGQTWEPGIQVHFDPATGILETKIKLEWDARIKLPVVGEIKIQTPILFQTRIKKQEQSWITPLPGTTLLFLPQIKIRTNHPRFPLNTHLEFLLSDQAEFDSDYYNSDGPKILQNNAWVLDPAPHWNLRIGGDLGNPRGTSFSWKAYLLPALDILNRYAWEDSLRQMELHSQLAFQNQAGPRFTSNISLRTFSQDRQIRIGFDLQRDKQDWILEGGKVHFQHFSGAGGRQIHGVQAQLDHLHLGEVLLQDLALDTQIEVTPLNEFQTQWTVPRLKISANPQSSDLKVSRGWVRGPVWIEQKPLPIRGFQEEPLLPGQKNHVLTFLWDRDSQELHLDRLDLSIRVGGIPLLPILKTQQRLALRDAKTQGESFGKWASGFGMDGKLAGHFTFNLAQWNGQGDLRILGDSEGDIYLHDRSGKKIDPPLFRNTNWRFRRFDQYLFDKGYALGAFFLKTTVNTAWLRKFGTTVPMEQIVHMGHRDVPLKPGAIDEVNEVFYELMRRVGFSFLVKDIEKSRRQKKETSQ